MSNARHLMELHLGRTLGLNETVDHINGDPLDDRIDNLQVMTLQDNIRKSAKPAEIYSFYCSMCGQQAVKPMCQVKHNWKQGKAGPFCGKKCARKFQILGGS